jgi:hypothetical protein
MSEPSSRANSAPQPASQPAAAPARRAGWRVALLGLIGVLALVLPLAQVLNLQVLSLAEDRAERARLDPLAEALALHRALAGHDAVSTRVLRGRLALEAERRLRKAGVDRDLAALQATLWAGDWPQARREATALRAGWHELAGAIEQRTLDAAASQKGHRLLQEQTVQVMDDVSASLGPGLAGAVLATLPKAQWAGLVRARQHELALRIGRAESARALAVLGLALAALAAALLAWSALTGLRPGAGATVPANAWRQGHGRRAADNPATRTPSEIAGDALKMLRRGAENECNRG